VQGVAQASDCIDNVLGGQLPEYSQTVLDDVTFHSEDVLLNRLRNAAGKREVVVLAGSALTMPVRDIPGVPTTAGMVDIVRAEFAGDCYQAG
jgi:hypothetical protein